MKIVRALAILVLVFGVANCFAQSVISGRVLNQADGKPIANASVFISNATIGDKTAADGSFTLRSLKPGKYELVVSIVGFEVNNQQLVVTVSNIKLPDIILLSKTMLLAEVKIKPVHDYNRGMYLNWFTDEFLGTSDIAKDCRIVNPEMLDFDYDNVKDILKASSVDFLVIENNTLGYRIKYLLTDFTLNRNRVERSFSYKGFVLFEEMTGSDAQKNRWLKARQGVYENSMMHFLRALVNNSLPDEGFSIQQLSIYYNPDRPPDTLIQAKVKFYTNLKTKTGNDNDSLAFWTRKSKIKANLLKLNTYSLDGREIAQKTNQEGVYALGCENDALYITYNKYGHFNITGHINNVDDKYNTENSIIKFKNDYAFFDANGWISDPQSVLISGVWAKKRVAELLPEDYYEPPSTKSNSAGLPAMATKLKQYDDTHPTEKTYLHLDNINYIPGDTVWFKAYNVAGEQHQLSIISNITYVDLLNAKDSLISRVALPLSTGIGWGDMALPAKLKPGKYHLMAYTNWMRNEDAAYFYTQDINIGDPQPLKIKKHTADVPDVQFFPEGGSLMNGLRSKVAIKVIDQTGHGIDAEGVVTDASNNEVARFTTQHLGMGVFAITPEMGKVYKTSLTIKNGSHYNVELPKAQDEGFSIAINNAIPDSLGIRIVASAKLFNAKKDAGYYLLAQAGGKVFYTADFKLTAQSFNTVIDTKRFPAGITRFTLFANTGEPLNERIVFFRNNDTLKLKLNLPGKTFGPRQKVKIGLDALTANNSNATGSFSVAVVNESFNPVDEASESTIMNNLLLTSDIKGYIEQPNYYFTGANAKTRADLDVLMLTQGYHRYEWKKVTDNSDKPIFAAEGSLQIMGSIKTLSGKPVPNAKVKLLTTRGGIFSLDTLADENGKFIFENLPADSAKYAISATTGKGKKDVRVMLDTLPVFKLGKQVQYVLTPDSVKELTTYQKQVKSQRKISLDRRLIQLKEVVIRENKEPVKDIISHAVNPDQVINDFPKEGTGESLRLFLATRLKNINVKSGNNGTFFYTYRAISRWPQPPAPMLVKLDGMSIDPLVFESIALTDIESAEVIRTTGKMDMTTEAKEVLYLISRKYHGGNKVTTPDMVTYQSNGLYKAREFYSPKYETINESSSKPDLRNTIYWNPVVITQDGKTSFEYYNADTKGTYRVTVEGIDADGNLGRAVYRYNVE